MGTAPRARRRVGFDLAISVAITIGLLVAAEVAARVFNFHAGYFLVPTQTNCLQRSSSLGMEFRPQCATTWSEFLLTGKQETTFTTNKLGLRDRELGDGDGKIRVLALGDSCTWGWQVGQDETYPRVLQRLLDERHGPGIYRVINAGAPGYTSYQGLIYLQEHGAELKPDVVIIAFGFNDSLTNGDVEQDLSVQQRMMPLIKTDDFLLSNSALWRWLRTKIRGEGPRPEQPVRVPPDKFKVNLERIIALVRERGAKPVLLSFSGPPNPKSAYARAMGDISREQEVPLVVYSGPRIDVVHPSAEGYEQLATKLLTRLEGEGYVTDGAQPAAQ